MGIYLILILLGLTVGSFVSAVTYRIPKGLGFVVGRSFCDSCKKELSWYDNIPLFSYLYYFGKSRCCSKPISIRYPLIEVTSLLGLLVTWFTFHNLAFVFLFFLTFCVLIIDIENQIIPDELTWLLLFFVLLFPIPYSLFPSLFSGFFFSLLLLTLYLLTKGRGMGLGDVKLAIPLGLILGIEKGVIWIILSFVLGGIVATVLLLFKKANLKTKIAFGPFLINAFWIVLIYEKIYPF